jgi:hypothetical protein
LSQPQRRGRTLTIVAVGALCLDGLLLGLIGLWSHRLVLLLIGGGLLLAAGGVILLWRRHQRDLVEIASVKAELRAEAQALRDLLKGDRLRRGD